MIFQFDQVSMFVKMIVFLYGVNCRLVESRLKADIFLIVLCLNIHFATVNLESEQVLRGLIFYRFHI